MTFRLENYLMSLKRKGEKALIPYLMAGDPNLKTTEELAVAIANSGADVLEIGIPFTDPIADGPVIQQAANRALTGGVTLKAILNTVLSIREKTSIPIVLMSYYNPLYQCGLEKFSTMASQSGVDGIIVPDLPLEESEPFRFLLQEKGICLVHLVSPNSGSKRIEAICKQARGFIYCVSVTGVTGERKVIDTDIGKFTSSVKVFSNLPVAVGFGISSSESANIISKYCDAVIIGSSLVNVIHKYTGDPELFSVVSEKIQGIKNALYNYGGATIGSL